jgi:hypothetical protein
MGGPWADLQCVQFEVTSSLATAMRPREYDFKAIERARGVAVQGMQAMLLAIYAFCYFLDRGKMDEAAEALIEAESIYTKCAADVSAELQTIFVFGEAYVRRNPVAARTWWMKLQAKNPTQFNVDYWSALSALRWIEGDLKGANEDWERCETEAKRLPGAGAYEFDWYCCKLLRTAIDESTSS